jgi:hypothetical protein
VKNINSDEVKSLLKDEIFVKVCSAFNPRYYYWSILNSEDFGILDCVCIQYYTTKKATEEAFAIMAKRNGWENYKFVN